MKTQNLRLRVTKFFLHHSSGGFTITEMLIASFITGIALLAIGSMLVDILKTNGEVDVLSSNRLEVNQAASFIADEIRRSERINHATDLAKVGTLNDSLDTTNEVESGTEQTVLVIKNPDFDDPIIYRIAQPKNSGTSVWQGPRVIYRWGPGIRVDNINDCGYYSNLDKSGGSNSSCTPSTAAWENKPLIDNLTDATISGANCNSPWTLSSSVQGFYSCVDSANQIATIHIEKQQAEVGKTGSDEKISVTTQVFARLSNSP